MSPHATNGGTSSSSSAASSSSSPGDDPLAYMDQLDFNTKKFPQYSHIIERTPNLGEKEKIVRVCRCWQSKKFPYCDDTHKVMMEAGDDVGPFVARLRDERGGRGGAEGESLKNTNASPHSLQSSSSSFSSLLRSFQIGRGRKVFAEDHAQILHQSSSSSSPRLFLRSLPVRAKPVIAAILMSGGLGYAIADFALKNRGRRESLGEGLKDCLSLQEKDRKEREEDPTTARRRPMNILSSRHSTDLSSSSSSTFVNSL